MVNDTALMLDDVAQRLKEEGVDLVRSTLIDSRYFSLIYELQGTCEGRERSYILKVSTTERTCQNEYEMYRYLSGLGIRTLTPVLYSDRFNYLVTVKEKLRDLPRVLKEHKAGPEVARYFFRLGRLLKEVESRTGKSSRFDKTEFDAYLQPRLQQMQTVGPREKEWLWRRVEALSAKLADRPVQHCLVSDYNLGNLHLDEEHQFVLLDMGDAYSGSSCSNLAAVYLSLKFGPLQQYFEDQRLTQNYFDAFLQGFGTGAQEPEEFLIYQIRDLVCMILFVEEHRNTSKNLVKRLLSLGSNRYLAARYWKYLKSLTEAT